MPDDPEGDLPWTAFRYVAGELSPGAASAFEARLADDQQAREAVAAAVELAGAVALIGARPGALPARPRRRFARAAGWVAGGVAAGLALGFGLDQLVLHRAAVAPPRVAEEVVSTWWGLRGEPDASAGLDDQLALNDDPAPEPAEPDADGDVPSWMAELATLPSPDATPRREN
jgi:hypothetical protein